MNGQRQGQPRSTAPLCSPPIARQMTSMALRRPALQNMRVQSYISPLKHILTWQKRPALQSKLSFFSTDVDLASQSPPVLQGLSLNVVEVFSLWSVMHGIHGPPLKPKFQVSTVFARLYPPLLRSVRSSYVAVMPARSGRDRAALRGHTARKAQPSF